MALRNLRKQIFNYFLMLGIIITFLFSISSYAYIKSHIVRNAETNLRLYATLASQIIEQKNEVLFTYLDGVERCLPYIDKKIDIDNTIEYLRAVSKESQYFEMLGIADSKGNLYFPSIEHDGYIAMDISEREYYRNALKGINSIMSPSRTLNPELDKKILVVYAIPIYEKDNIKGVLVAIAESDFIYNQIKDIKLGLNGYAYIVDSYGQTIAHPNKVYINPEFNVLRSGLSKKYYNSLATFIKKSMEEDIGVGEYAIGGEYLYSGYSKINGTNWTAYIVEFKSEILRLLYPITFGIIIINLVIIIIGFFIYKKIKNEILRKDAELTEERSSLEYEAAYDELTNVYNRRYGMIVLSDRLKLAVRTNEPFTIAYIDIDNLKITNDKIGHLEGDRFIKTISEVFVNNLRKSDFISRLGGDEFLVGFYNCNIENAELILKKIQDDLDNKFFDLGFEFPLLFSYGLAIYNPEEHIELESLIREADEKMYIHKNLKK